MHQSVIQVKTTIQAFLSALLDQYELVISPVFRPLLRTSQPRPGLLMQRVRLFSRAGQPAPCPVLPSATIYPDRAIQ
ncbi:hypothetical protein [Spirosoma rhododendri]|uniref:Uncharacterized protein n=1 Tax=Spirosoma rhododendri TaxID=2728024 RepID=A0A7L5DGV1_9BACT|nr:hypothetical protein [Spirosoma rhododendri]QJD77504.1 hypothetical protein HH216_03050 [Spirosoma rhododendri]